MLVRLSLRFACTAVLCGVAVVCVAQKKDKEKKEEESKRDSLTLIQAITNSKLARELADLLKARPFSDTARQEKSETRFLPYEGKIIRDIHIDNERFSRPIRQGKGFAASVERFAHKLHTNTRSITIKQHLFFAPGQRLNPYRLADNERFLRDQDFILDSRIVVEPIDDNGDSVDVHIYTRDVFSLGGRFSPGNVDEVKLGVYDANLMGLGQRLDASLVVDGSRTPVAGVSAFYRKSSLLGSLANVTVGFTQLNDASSFATEYEYAYFLRISRPLVSPYSRWAGGFELSRNWSRNVRNFADSLFLRYAYNVRDIWLGYNIGIKNNMNDRTRHFVAVRYFDQRYTRQPAQELQQSLALYNDRKLLLAELTFYEQNFYKTNYIFGFGRTEDIPYGTTFTLTGGWSKELNNERPYFSADFNKSLVAPEGNFYTIRAAAGGYYRNEVQDAVYLVSANFFSRLLTWRRNKVRQSFEGGYTQLSNQRTANLLTINNQLRGFTPDSLVGFKRFYFRSETTVFTKWNLANFRFAPFVALEAAVLRVGDEGSRQTKFYPGIGGGIRTRNENLIFGTLEARFFFFPARERGVSLLEFRLSSNLRLKYSASFVRPPDQLIYN